MKVKTAGIQSIIIFCVGSGGAGLSFICSHMVNPMTSGQAPSIRNGPSSGRWEGSQGMSPNRLNTVVGSGADKSLIQPKNGAWRISMVTTRTLERGEKSG